MNRIIVHSDLDSFYASVECLKDPKIRNFPVAVTGDPKARHGIILAKNQLAKKCGVKTGDPLWMARQKCKDIIFVPANFSAYLKFSKMARDIYLDYTDQVESYGIDENWCDLTGSVGLFGDGVKIATEIRKRIYSEMGITASVGISYNKIFAKLGSDQNKPDGMFIIKKDDFKEKVWRLPVSELLYVGKSTNNKLSKLNIKTIGELANYDSKYLRPHLGKWGDVLQVFANGNDNTPVAKNGEESFIKSIGNSITAPRDLETLEDVKAIIFMLSESVATRLRKHCLKCTTIQISVRNKSLFSCERQSKLSFSTCTSLEIGNKALEIFQTKYKMLEPVRSIGVRGTDLVPENENIQLDLFFNSKKREKIEMLERSVDEIRNRFGYHSIQKGTLIVDRNLTGINVKDTHVIHPHAYLVR